jgi:hypothetical protein
MTNKILKLAVMPQTHPAVKHNDMRVVASTDADEGLEIHVHGPNAKETADLIVLTCATNDQLAKALQRLIERYEMERSKPASGAIPHEITVARIALKAAGYE